jgi:hypothetical protein
LYRTAQVAYPRISSINPDGALMQLRQALVGDQVLRVNGVDMLYVCPTISGFWCISNVVCVHVQVVHGFFCPLWFDFDSKVQCKRVEDHTPSAV